MDTTRRDNVAFVGVAFAFMLGLYARFLPVFATDFPLNDGGMFYMMAQEVRAAHYHLPILTAYNAEHIPFAYPPFAFYLAATLADLTGASLLTMLRFLPACLSALGIPAFYLLSREFLQTRAQTLYATCIFALLPRSYAWMIMGGGLTRAPGYTFAILALSQAYLLYTRREPRFIVTTTLCATMTALTHAEMTWFIAYSIALMWLFYGRDLKSFGASLVVVVGTILLSAPWWFTVVRRYGFAPFEAAAQTGGKRWFTWHPDHILSEPFFPILAYVALAGLIACALKKRFFLPAWVLLIFFVQPRSAKNLAAIPLALAIGLALDEVILPALERFNPRRAVSVVDEPNEMSDTPRLNYTLGLPQVAILSALMFYTLFCAWLSSAYAPQLKSLSADDRTALQWVATHTAGGSRFVILTADAPWDDRIVEWFPALTHRVSINTIQGSEWLPHQQFNHLWDQANKMAACGSGSPPTPGLRGIPCLQQWTAQWNTAFNHIYIRKEPTASPQRNYWQAVEQALRTSAHWTVVYDAAGATIFAANGQAGAKDVWS